MIAHSIAGPFIRTSYSVVSVSNILNFEIFSPTRSDILIAKEVSDGKPALRCEIMLSAVTVLTRAGILLAAVTAVAVIFSTCED